MCQHQPPCPSANTPDHRGARIEAEHWDQGWCRLCNGVVIFDDGGEFLPDGRVVPPPHHCRAAA